MPLRIDRKTSKSVFIGNNTAITILPSDRQKRTMVGFFLQIPKGTTLRLKGSSPENEANLTRCFMRQANEPIIKLNIFMRGHEDLFIKRPEDKTEIKCGAERTQKNEAANDNEQFCNLYITADKTVEIKRAERIKEKRKIELPTFSPIK